MFRFVSRRLAPGRRTSQGPTLTIKVDSGVAGREDLVASGSKRTAKDRIVRPLSEEEENYELMRVRKNAGSNLQIRGKHAVQTNRKTASRTSSSAMYDQY
jgi:hypothetical protein